jgi:alternate signal-mediated exported protein
MMNKLTKGTIAGAAGIVLLLGGAGTFALWNDTADIPGGTVTSGTLSFDDVAPGVWQDISPDVDGQPITIDPATFLTVPGDVLAYTSEVVVNATGNNLLADFGVTYDNSTALPTGFTAAVTVEDSLGAPVTGPIQVTDGDTYTVVVTLTFDITTAGQVSQDTPVDLGGIDLTLTQVRPLP